MSITLSPSYFEDQIIGKILEGGARACGLVGDIAEFGPLGANGRSAHLLAQVIGLTGNTVSLHEGIPKSLHIHSSFAGLPPMDSEIDRTCPMTVSREWVTGQPAAPSQADLMARCTASIPADRVKIMRGWHKDTIAALPADTRYAMVHLDCALYASTLEVLTGLLERGMLSEGALLFFSDWDANRASPKWGQRRAWGECVEKYGIEYSDGGAYGLRSRVFIVHSYRGEHGHS